jgi:death-on-curing protein
MRYLNLNEVLEIHRILINRYGGASGIRDLNGLESALYRPQTGYYADTIAEAAALMESIVINHPFIDGNKRVAFAVTDVFLRLNGFKIVEQPMRIHEKMMQLFETYQFDFIHVELMLREIVKLDP